MPDLAQLLTVAVNRNASDLHVRVGSPPMLRLDGSLTAMPDQPRLTKEDVSNLAKNVLGPSQAKDFSRMREIDVALSLSGLGRFRVNVFMQRGTIGMVFRIIPRDVLSIEQLNLPPVLKDIAMENRGLVLVTGTTGSGKTTCLASLIDVINCNRMVHITTIEDPIEYLHRDKKSIIDQREVGVDTRTFADALRAAMRQDPDVILVGEMRDYDTIKTAIMAAETGHLVFSTLHTTDATETINRIISFFPETQQQEIRYELASVLRAIVSLRLLPRADGKGRVPAVEVLIATITIREALLDKVKTKTIPDIIAASRTQYGMQTFDQSIFDIYQRGLIAYDEAIKMTSRPDDFALRVKGISSTSDEGWDKGGQPPGTDIGDDFKIQRFGS